MNLSEHFTLAEFTASDTAARRGIDNTPSAQIIGSLTILAAKMEEVRVLLGYPVSISSAFRCSALTKISGSKPTSKHVQGQAADFRCDGYGSLLDVIQAIRKSGIVYDQLILEFFNPTTGGGWVHIGMGAENRKQLLTINSSGTFAGVRV